MEGRKCMFPDCHEKHHAKDCCHKHYQQLMQKKNQEDLHSKLDTHSWLLFQINHTLAIIDQRTSRLEEEMSKISQRLDRYAQAQHDLADPFLMMGEIPFEFQ
eukprot:TRINITY_DN19659_c0_g1_i1.p2 TRINITY_DN19659_c0_g1~~TRINITY_DN19659_c0_g1_i1.p2  ORF type:complete len:102 (-),score=23.67 TRINITY_DN19659_c0_g1_i1:112-417(-)